MGFTPDEFGAHIAAETEGQGGARGCTTILFEAFPIWFAGGRVPAVGVVVAGGTAGTPAAGVLVGSAVAPLPHSAFRKSFHFIPLSVPDLRSLYLALHSFIVRACAFRVPSVIARGQIVPMAPYRTPT